ncbi:coiled-coil domain-containing protein 121-like [Nannospalax galili]|uniref:coiled-coil domain-containing protein 121-like n=1 Tax=Nannospalax galili TaxID=1026970 RepID=UPI0004ED26C3|nr:coiled-coil domain-containing protein 121-like [Nannospalax galili]
MSAPPAQLDEASLLTLHDKYRPTLARNMAMCDFWVKWPELVLQTQKKKESHPSRQSSQDWLGQTISTCSSAISLSVTELDSCPSEPLESHEGAPASPQASPQKSPYITILNHYLKSNLLTWPERTVKRRPVTVVSQLEQEMKPVKSRKEVLLRDSRELQKEKSFEDADTQPFLEYLKQKKEQSQQKYDSLWREHFKGCQEVEDRRQELVSTYASRTADLQKKLSQGRKVQLGLRKQLRTLKPIAGIRESQERKLRALEQEQASIPADTRFMDREAHIQFLQERAALEKQVQELNLLESGENITRELKKKAKALAATAKQAHTEFCRGVNTENRQLWEGLRQLDQEYCKLEARRKKLEKRKQQWKEQQWYVEALIRGRQRLQEQQQDRRLRQGCPKPQAAPHPHRAVP